MDKRICELCKAENEAHYEYCKNCGNKLAENKNGQVYSKPVVEQNDAQYTPVSSYTSSQTNGVYTAKEQIYNNQHEIKAPVIEKTYGLNEIDGVKTEDLAAYIGPNNQRIITKFAKMELTGSKASWCWPSAAWALLGPFGVAIWFIYRKMYKLGIIILAAGILLNGVLNVASSLGTSSFEIFNDSYDSGALEEIPEIEQGNRYNEYTTLITDIAYISDSLISMTLVVLSGIFSMYAYKKHTIKKIKQQSLVNTCERYHQLGLMAVGGTSAGFAILALLVAAFLSNMISEIAYLFI